MSGVLVFCEAKDGKLKKASRETLSIGRQLAAKAGGDLIAVANEAVADEAGRYGAKKLYVLAAPYLTETWTAALESIAKEASPSIVLLPGTSNGRDLAPRIAARLGVGVASDVDRLEWAGDKLQARRPLYAGRAFATVEITGTPAIATTRPPWSANASSCARNPESSPSPSPPASRIARARWARSLATYSVWRSMSRYALAIIISRS